MAAGERIRLSVAERKRQLLELGMKLFGSRSYADISVTEIAKAAGISSGLLYHYFPGKRTFYVETVRHAADQLRARVEGSDAHLSPIDRLRSGLHRYLEYVQRFGPAYVALLRSGIGFDDQVGEIVETTRAKLVAGLMEGMGFESPAPTFRVAIRGWIGLVESASLEWLERQDVERDALVAMMVEGLAGVLRGAVREDPEAARSLSDELRLQLVAAE